jgi:hypothetical protein
MDFNASALGPGPGTPIIFDGTPTTQTPDDDSQITWDKTFTVASITIEDGFTVQETLAAGANLDVLGAAGTALAEDAGSDLKFQFDDHNQLLEIDKDATINNMDITGYSDDTLLITGGTTTIAGGNYTENLGVSLMVDTGGTLSDKGQCTLNLTASNQVITVNGTMNVSYGTGTGITLIGSAANSFNYIYVGGDLTYLGSGNVADDTFNVPVWVYGNTGEFKLQSAPGQPNGGKLTVTDQSNYVFPNGSQYSVYMADAGDQVTLSQGAWLKCANAYYQADGSLTTDNTLCMIQGGATGVGTVTIAGGVVTIDNVLKTYNTLYVVGNIQISGELSVSIDASNPGTRDLLEVTGTTNLTNNPTLSVTVNNGPPAPNQGPWTIIRDDNFANITGNFVMPITTNPKTNLTPKVENRSYNLYS